MSPTAQSGRAGSGCLDEVDVDVYVRREDEDVVEDDCKRQQRYHKGKDKRGRQRTHQHGVMTRGRDEDGHDHSPLWKKFRRRVCELRHYHCCSTYPMFFSCWR